MNEDDAPEGTPFDDFLRKMLGDEAAEEAARALRAQGFDPSRLPSQFSDPNALNAALSQFQYLMTTTTGPVNWSLVTDSARQQVYTAGDPVLTAAQAERARRAMSVADLWLDTATDFAPGPVERAAWTRTQWIDATLDMWKRICEPVAANVSRALGEALAGQFSGDNGLDESSLPEGLAQMVGQTRQMVPKLSAMMFAAQIGRALTALAGESLGSTDVGIPLAKAGTTGLVVSNVEAFGDGLDIPFDEVLQFVAVRECAHRRLFSSVPWLEGDLIRAVERYSAQIEIDADAISEAARNVDPSDPASIERAMSGGVFAITVSDAQRRALERLETILALVEGWVEVITARAIAPYLPHADQLREMMRRRRAAGGPAEQVLGDLIGLRMRPRRARGAARIFDLVEADGGRDARDALWSHPDMVPTMTELDTPNTFLAMRQAASEQDADIDAALDALLGGTMGWADGVAPGVDPEAETLAKAGFDVEAPSGSTSIDEGGAPGSSESGAGSGSDSDSSAPSEGSDSTEGSGREPGEDPAAR